MSAVGVGVIGLGFMGRTHVACVQEASRDGFPCRLVAVADPDPERRSGRGVQAGNIRTGEGASRLFDPGEVRAHADWRDLLRDSGVSLVSVCTPTPTHVDLAIAALEAGKHVLVEKPPALTSLEARRLAHAARRARTICMPALCIRFWPAYAWAAGAIESGEFGAVRSATFHRLGSTPTWTGFYADDTQSGGAIIDLHMHDADFVLRCFGRPSSVTSAGSTNHLTTLYRYERGPRMVVAEGGWGHDAGFGFRMRFVACFERGTLEFDLGRTPQFTLARGGKCEAIDVGPRTGYDEEIRHLVACITEGRARADVTCDDAVAALELLEAERASLESGKPVAL